MPFQTSETSSSPLSSFFDLTRRYWHTIWSVYRNRELLQQSVLDRVMKSDGILLPIGPGVFLLISYLLFGSLEVFLAPQTNSFELPEALSALSYIFRFLPEISTFVTVTSLGICYAFSGIILIVSRNNELLKPVFGDFCYMTGGILLPLFVVAILIRNYFHQSFWWVDALICVIGLVWVARQMKTEHGLGSSFLYLTIVIANIPIIMVAMFLLFTVGPKQNYSIVSSSMAPTFLIGEGVTANRWVFGWRDPYRGEIVAFLNAKRGFSVSLKRIVGLPEDTIQMIGGVLQINGKPVILTPAVDFMESGRGGATRTIKQYLEMLPNGVSYHVLDTRTDSVLDDTLLFSVPKDHYFVLGDNRDRSTDSRVQRHIGFISKDNLIGSIYSLAYPLDKTYLPARPEK